MKKILTALVLCSAFTAHADEVIKFKARYTIPTIQVEDAQFASFDLVNYTLTKKDPTAAIKAEMKYELPFEMTGVNGQTIQMNLLIEKLPLRVFEGEKAIALCEGAWAQMKCTMRFKKIDINLDQLEDELTTRGLNQTEITSRINMIERFAAEPLGVSEVTGPVND